MTSALTRVGGGDTLGATRPRVPNVQMTRVITHYVPQGAGIVTGHAHTLTRAMTVYDSNVGQVHTLLSTPPRGQTTRVIAGDGHVLARALTLRIVRVILSHTDHAASLVTAQGQV